jgi:hypothetical protein
VGYPLFAALLVDAFQFHLDWSDAAPSAKSFADIPPSELAKCGLLPDFARAWRAAAEIRRLTKDNVHARAMDCFVGLSHYIRRYIQPTFFSDIEGGIRIEAQETGMKFARIQERCSEIRAQFRYTWTVDCPFCGEVETLVLDLDLPEGGAAIGINRAICANCDLVVPAAPHLAQILFADELKEALPNIVKAYSLTD